MRHFLPGTYDAFNNGWRKSPGMDIPQRGDDCDAKNNCQDMFFYDLLLNSSNKRIGAGSRGATGARTPPRLFEEGAQGGGGGGGGHHVVNRSQYY